MGADGGAAIAAALGTNTTVTSLNLGSACPCVRPPPPHVRVCDGSLARVCACMCAWCAGNNLGAVSERELQERARVRPTLHIKGI